VPQHGLKITPNSSTNASKTNPKSIQNDFKIDPSAHVRKSSKKAQSPGSGRRWARWISSSGRRLLSIFFEIQGGDYLRLGTP